MSDSSSESESEAPSLPSTGTVPVPHLRVYSQCGACNRPVNRKDVLIATKFRLFSTFAGNIYKVPVFKKGERVKRESNAVFCKMVDCTLCSMNVIGNATYHADCFNLFGKYCHAEDKYSRLWLAARTMSPMETCACLKLLYDPVASQQLNIVFELLGLQRLPLTLTRNIWEFDPKSSDIVARFCSVLQLAAEMNSAPTVPSSCPLSEMRFWSRGQYHTVQKDMGSELPFVRVTVDSRGVKKLERVNTPSSPRSDGEVSVIMLSDLFSNMEASFGRLRGVIIRPQIISKSMPITILLVVNAMIQIERMKWVNV
ncbi:hypothetical protein TrVFT333_001528 [Trichoderma virens FT-333]|nr:hypothetical protein TrVFT333_001528 [Trichoderma virens FT-333]